jgi:hypothetical protein
MARGCCSLLRVMGRIEPSSALTISHGPLTSTRPSDRCRYGSATDMGRTARDRLIGAIRFCPQVTVTGSDRKCGWRKSNIGAVDSGSTKYIPGLAPLTFLAVSRLLSEKPWIKLIFVIGAILLTGACDYGEFPADAITIRNASSQTVEVVAIIRPHDEQLISTVEPGLGDRFRDDCLDPDLEARATDGHVLARREGPFCRGDPEWVITDDG